ncbi:sensor histidine kinase [Anaerorhabdus sp.]|uniref:sensor histidine kinase n=1 Tax=Anaerorhabdus sp. TaxID=1872524 RepID=UPI002FC9C059
MNNKNRFQEKLRKQILKITFIIVFVALVIFYVSAALYDGFNSKRKLSLSNELIQEQFMEMIYQCDRSFLEMSQNKDILNFFTSKNKESAVYQELYTVNQNTNLKYNLVLFDHEGEMIFTSFKGIEFDAVNKSYQKLVIRDCNASKESIVLSYNATIQGSANEFTVIADKIDEVGYALYYVKDVDLLGAIERKPADHFMIIDSHNQVLVASDSQLISKMNRSAIDLSENEIKINNLFYSKQSIEIYPGIELVSFLYKDSIINNKSLILIMILVAAFLAVVLNYYSRRISANTSNSLNILLDEMDKIKKGNLEELNVHTNDEFEIIAEETNEMIREIKQLGKRNEQLVDLRRQIEIKQLESQFNPHFLYNTLETIRYTMLMNQQAASDLILKLTKILRYSISDSSDKVTFIEDLEYIQSFLEIMKFRFQERFEYLVKIDEKCYHRVIPKLIVQPLIENSIRHNYKDKKNLTVWLTADIEDNLMIIEVEDNGDGMSEEELLEIRKVIAIDGKMTGNHIGLSNVAKRLYLLYGNKTRIEISSRKGIGTKVSIIIELGDE